VTTTETGTEPSTEPSTEPATSTKVKTGDEKPLGKVFVLLLVSILSLTGLIVYRKSDNRRSK
jgi:hypothetical protein